MQLILRGGEKVFGEKEVFMCFSHVSLQVAYIMDKISKLNMFYNLVNAQGIRVMVTIGTSSSPLTYAPVLAPISIVSTSALVLKVDHLVDVKSTLKAGDPNLPPISAKKAQKEEPQYP